MRNKKNMVIGILCLTLVFMGIGYSLFSSTLNITGSSQSSGTFDVKITNVEVDENQTTSGATDTMNPIGENYAVTETTLEAEFNAPGDYITYNVTVTNRGSIDATITVETNMLDSTDSFELSCTVQEGTEVTANGGHITFPCVMRFKESVDSLSNVETAHMRVSLKAIQKATYTPPAAQTTPDYCFVSFIEGEINYYDTSLQGCGSDVVMPDNLSLKIATVTDYTVDDEKCEEEAEDNETTCQAIKDELATIFSNYGYADTDNGVLSSDYAYITTPIYSEGSGTSYSIDKIGGLAFKFSGLSSISMSNSIVEIGVGAFVGNSLQSITFPGSLEVIGDIAFAYNSLSGTLTIPASVETIGYAAFGSEDENSGISSLVFENGSHLQSIGGYAFINNTISGTLTIPASVETIGAGAFAFNRINTLNLGSGLLSLGDGAFLLNLDDNDDITLTTINIDMTEATWNSRNVYDSENGQWYASDENVPVVNFLQD